MSRLHTYFNTLRRPALLALAALAGLSLSRAFLLAAHWDRVDATGGAGFILLQGLRFDLILAGMLLGPVFVLKPWFHTRPVLRRAGRLLFPLYLGLAAGLAFFIEAATLPFIGEFDARPNYLFVEYLSHPREVFSTLAASHTTEFTASTLLAVLLAWAVARWLFRDPNSSLELPAKFCLSVTPFAAAVVFLMIRSTLDHRPVNPSMAAFSEDYMVNQLALNSPYSLLYAIYEM